MQTRIEKESNYRERPDFSKLAVVALFLIAIAFVVSLKFGPKLPGKGQFKEEPTNAVVRASGKMILKTKEAKHEFTPGQEVSLLVYADSANHVINGFDIVLNFAPTELRHIRTTGLLDDFQIVSVTRDDRVTITGFKKLNATSKKVLAGEPIAELVFAPVKSGQVQLVPTFVPGKTTNSNLVDEGGRQTLGSVEGVSFTVK